MQRYNQMNGSHLLIFQMCVYETMFMKHSSNNVFHLNVSGIVIKN